MCAYFHSTSLFSMGLIHFTTIISLDSRDTTKIKTYVISDSLSVASVYVYP